LNPHKNQGEPEAMIEEQKRRNNIVDRKPCRHHSSIINPCHVGLDNHALRPLVVPRCLPNRSLLIPSSQSLFALEDHVTPTTLGIVSILTNASIKDFHPAFFVSSGIGVEINYLAVVEANTEAFFNEHVTLFLFCEARFTTLAPLSTSLLLSKSTTIINELASIGKIDCGSRLSSRLMVRSELAPGEFEEATTPILIIR
jgi:hypothetical protein